MGLWEINIIFRRVKSGEGIKAEIRVFVGFIMIFLILKRIIKDNKIPCGKMDYDK